MKHHLRAMAPRDDMLTTYEHDFGVMTRPNFKGRSTSFGASWYGEGGKASRAHRDMLRTASLSASNRIAPPKAWQEGDNDQEEVRSIRSGNFGSRERDHSGTLGCNTMSKMHKMKHNDDDPMRLTVNGWGDQRWNPKTHPSMILGMSCQRGNLVQTANLMNLRASDLPFSTR